MDGSSYGYAGEWTDASGLQYLRARCYSPSTGRFISKDPFPGLLTQPASLTPYVYALNSPVLLTDPSGENPLLLVGGLGGLLGGAIYGYGSQVVRNLNQGMCFWDALSTNIAAGQVALYAGVGTVLGLGMGGAMVGIQALAAYIGTAGIAGTTPSVQQAIHNGINSIRNGIGQGYNSFQSFKYSQGSAGVGMAWHHIVTQTTAKLQRFGAQVIHNTTNIIRLPQGPGSLHQQISNLYNSINPAITGSNTLSVYQWLQTQSFEDQWRFGIELISQLGGAQYIIDKFH